MQNSSLFTALQSKLENLAESRWIFVWLFVLSFCESTFVPIPFEALLIPLMLTCREKIWRFALFATLGCLLGASVGYVIGALFFESWSTQIASFFGSPEQLQLVMQKMQQDGFMYVLAVGMTPVPFQIAMLSAGAIQYSFILFLIATLVSRGIRYFGLAALVFYFGEFAADLLQRYKYQAAGVISLVFIVFFSVKLELV